MKLELAGLRITQQSLDGKGWHEFCPLLRIESAAKFLAQDVMPGCLQQDRRDLAEARFVDTSVQDGSR